MVRSFLVKALWPAFTSIGSCYQLLCLLFEVSLELRFGSMSLLFLGCSHLIVIVLRSCSVFSFAFFFSLFRVCFLSFEHFSFHYFNEKFFLVQNFHFWFQTIKASYIHNDHSHIIL